ncbi:MULTISPECIES: hypothetical protein [unclassified Janthinobacterium]|uniref:hypothetical protein n=1 Tax=unclassified Janthinobacterium TaxID=2610881 RepID=UPI00160DAEE9|nr:MULTISPECIES: hypothetical protein [unclassified Janthinobacterium]MBB5610602.1 hypothetical protein [Janthinobacterium sp. S3T4]MBB5616088.1 hypothetical protein [Janthinobacterium sp. S3M3]
MKPSLNVLACLLLLGAALFCAQRWGRETGRAACAASLAEAQGALRRQDQALTLMREEGTRRAAHAKMVLAGAREGRADSEQAATRILALQPDGDACTAAEALIAREMP